jgi:hypothetical protein
MQRFLKITLATVLFAMIAVSANAQTIGAEDDTWITGNGTQVDFANFGNLNIGQLLGSTPVNTVVHSTEFLSTQRWVWPILWSPAEALR